MPNPRSRSAPRPQQELTHLRRSPAQSHARTQEELFRRTEFPGKPPLKRLQDFLQIRVFDWAYHYAKSRFGRRYPFQDYLYGLGETGVYKLGDRSGRETVRISLAADWATGTEESQRVAHQIARFRPHYTIHLGDCYYVGTKEEIEKNFFSGVTWPLGSRGSFALNGNHEMYAKGKAYFKTLLPRLGLRRGKRRTLGGQPASFFCLENRWWRIVGLDTGYNSVRRIPFSEKLVGPSCKLPDPLLRWLREAVEPSRDRRGLILLSHHQYFSAFEDSYEAPARQLASYIDRPVLWFWGHEHRLALYGKWSGKNGVEAYGRCIGHGGMPVEDHEKIPRRRRVRHYRLVTYDARRKGQTDSVVIGYNGFVNLTLRGTKLWVDYRDLENTLLLREAWEVDLATGRLRGLGIRRNTDLGVPAGLNLPPLEEAQR